jgi:hypothetical protein
MSMYLLCGFSSVHISYTRIHFIHNRKELIQIRDGQPINNLNLSAQLIQRNLRIMFP